MRKRFGPFFSFEEAKTNRTRTEKTSALSLVLLHSQK
jgi:hypothetical protein